MSEANESRVIKGAVPPLAVARLLRLPETLFNLFFRPRRFFAPGQPLDEPHYYQPALYCIGLAMAIQYLDWAVFRRTLAGTEPGLPPQWVDIWLSLAAAGLVNALLVWFVGGWWYRLRLQWSGAVAPDKLTPRLVYVYASFVEALPTVLLLAIQTGAYHHYSDTFGSPANFALLLFPIWACIVSYHGATTRYALQRRRALFWFVLLPGGLYIAINAATFLVRD